MNLKTVVLRNGKSYIVNTTQLPEALCGHFRYETTVAEVGLGKGGIMDGELYPNEQDALAGHKQMVDDLFTAT